MVSPEEIERLFHDSKFMQEIEEREAAKYPPELRDASIFHQGKETPAQYRERLDAVYPLPVQQAVLDAAWQVNIAGLAMDACMLLSERQNLPDRLAALFPLALNAHLVGHIPKDSEEDAMVIVMDRDAANQVIAACNIAAVKVHSFAAERLKEAEEVGYDVVRGKRVVKRLSSEDLRRLGLTRDNFAAARKTFRGVSDDADLRSGLHVYFHTLVSGLTTKPAAEALQKVTGMLGGPFHPFGMGAMAGFFGFHMDSVDIWSQTGISIRDAAREDHGLDVLPE